MSAPLTSATTPAADGAPATIGDSDAARSRYIVGMDLGTTNSAVAYVDTAANAEPATPAGSGASAAWMPRTLEIPQLTAPGLCEPLETLPSFHYEPATGEFPPQATRLPWEQQSARWLVGQFARDHGGQVAGRLVVSAKSWLCHTGVDRTADLLPWDAAEGVTRVSPVTVSSRYLQHVRAVWDARFPEAPLHQQDFVLTIPASFDEVARELTLRAARLAGLERVILIEEPQAAFYAWIAKHSGVWDRLVQPGQTILVIDIGGGTSDFTLIRAGRNEKGLVRFQRIAVGEHLILGGDNFDLALAGWLEPKFASVTATAASGATAAAAASGSLPPHQWSLLVRQARLMKEALLGADPPERWTVALATGGSKLIGGTRTVEVRRDDVLPVLLDGFFPVVDQTARPNVARTGFREFGLPYAADAGITRYLAAFLDDHLAIAAQAHDAIAAQAEGSAVPPRVSEAEQLRPDLLLFNGGVFESPLLRERVVAQLSQWYQRPGETWRPTVLDNDRLDQAVARGAAYYGLVRRGVGVRITAGLPRSYYVLVEASNADGANALCVAPAGLEPGVEVEVSSRAFSVRLGEPIEFPLLSSSVRLTDRPGSLVVPNDEQFRSLAPIRTILKGARAQSAGDVPATLRARLSEIGTLELWLRELEGTRTWKLQFDVRSATQSDVAVARTSGEEQGVVDEATTARARQQVVATFVDRTADVATLVPRLTEAIGLDRHEWPTSVLRELWSELIRCDGARAVSPAMEARWLNLAGYCLRPGYGYALDDWRVEEAWKKLQTGATAKLRHASPASRAEWWVFWRRVAGGLTAGQQQALVGPLLVTLKTGTQQAVRGVVSRAAATTMGVQELSELWRLAGACELLPLATKVELGQFALEVLQKPGAVSDSFQAALVWTLGRLGSRHLAYGPLNALVPVEAASRWADRLQALPRTDALAQLAVMQLVRRTHDRYRDVDPGARERALQWLATAGAASTLQQMVRDGGLLDREQQGQVLGDELPRGLRLT